MEPDPKNSIFCVVRVTFDYSVQSLQETVLPKAVVPMESRDSEGVPFASYLVENHFRTVASPGAFEGLAVLN